MEFSAAKILRRGASLRVGGRSAARASAWLRTAFSSASPWKALSHWDAKRVLSARPAISAALSRAGVMRGELEQGIARVSEALSRTLEDERGRWLLSPHPEHRCELAVSAVIEGSLEHVRVDRTFIEEGTRWLIDYKITEQLGGDSRRFVQMQVEKYRPDHAALRSRSAHLRPASSAVRALSSAAGGVLSRGG